MTPEERFWGRVEKEDGCWAWTGGVNRGGYGQMWMRGSVSTAHRIAYRLMVGEIPAGLHVDHLCRNRRCVNPAHLEAVTPAENNLRQPVRERVTICPRCGVRPKVRDYCGECRREYMRAWLKTYPRLRRGRNAAA